ncbi:hypothetical protein TNIN_275151 [Trichonephila inaurata madagascariensis]|uniref:Uncharacterized protein n=1 Tax=Trichonephila inaurata madagascariensis TaxID=2747483 RepID=A0A8X6IRZ9_9ARAC|nr:hypothetical protein TNIN_275151 [Trichonephila inaurata madagascariensis]
MSNQTYRLIRYYLGKEPCEMLRFVKIRRHWEVLICVTGVRFVTLLMLAVVWESENEMGLMGKDDDILYSLLMNAEFQDIGRERRVYPEIMFINIYLDLRHWFGDYRVHCNGSDGRRELLIISELEMEE